MAAVAKLREDASASKLAPTVKVVGVDTEWYAPRVKGIAPSKTSLIQVCSSAEYCAVFWVGKMEHVPASLWNFMRDEAILKVRMEQIHMWELFRGRGFFQRACVVVHSIQPRSLRII